MPREKNPEAGIQKSEVVFNVLILNYVVKKSEGRKSEDGSQKIEDRIQKNSEF